MKRVWSVAFSPDSKKLVSGCGAWSELEKPGEVKIWDVQTGKTLLTLNDRKGAICQVGFAPDGKSVISASWDGTVRFSDPANGMAKTWAMRPASICSYTGRSRFSKRSARRQPRKFWILWPRGNPDRG